jgi:hypothetical protein
LEPDSKGVIAMQQNIKNKIWFFIIILFSCVMVFSQTVNIKMCVWADEDGVQHFSESPAFNKDNIPKFKEMPTVKSTPGEEIDAGEQKGMEKKAGTRLKMMRTQMNKKMNSL